MSRSVLSLTMILYTYTVVLGLTSVAPVPENVGDVVICVEVLSGTLDRVVQLTLSTRDDSAIADGNRSVLKLSS